MEQVPHWLEVTVFAAGMTAYAEEVDGASVRGIAAGDAAPLEPPAGPDATH